MAYSDYSSHWVLDQFLTFLEANQLGANDEHLYDTIATEHNINTSTIDGTHKANSILGSYINTTTISTGSASGTWTPSVGVYQIVSTGLSGLYDVSYIELYISGAWRTVFSSYASGPSADGIIFCDGSNMRIVIDAGGTIYYQKF